MSTTDVLYLRHEPLPVDEPYAVVPGYDYEEQSANSEEINVGGKPSDVLLNIRGGEPYTGYQIACLPVEEVLAIIHPNKNTVAKKLRSHGPDMFSFRVFHVPGACMYPHCEIRPFKDADPSAELKLEDSVKSLPRTMRALVDASLAEIAERHRQKMRRHWEESNSGSDELRSEPGDAR